MMTNQKQLQKRIEQTTQNEMNEKQWKRHKRFAVYVLMLIRTADDDDVETVIILQMQDRETSKWPLTLRCIHVVTYIAAGQNDL